VVLGERGAHEAAEALLQMLKERRAEVEVGVVVALGLLREERAVETLISLLLEAKEGLWKTPEPPASWFYGYYINALLRIGTDRALEAVLATNPYDFSPGILRALAQFGEKAAASLAKVALTAGNDGADREKVKAAIASLGEVGGELAISTLKTKLESPHKEIVLAAYNSLAKVGYRPVDEAERLTLILAGDNWLELTNMGNSAVPLLTAMLVSSPSWAMRRSAAVALQRLSWTPTDEAQKLAYFLALGEFEQLKALGDIAVNDMLAAMSDKNYDERKRVISALARMQLGPKMKLHVFNALVSSLNSDEGMPVAATNALGEMGCPGAVSPLIDKLNDWNNKSWGNEALEGALCAALGQLGDARAMDILKTYAESGRKFESVQKAAQAALAKIDPSYPLKRQEEEKEKLRQAEEAKRKKEAERRASLQAKRKSTGQCINCGERMNFVQKLFGKDRHGGCTSFKN
jgi:HEAT repeat protein